MKVHCQVVWYILLFGLTVSCQTEDRSIKNTFNHNWKFMLVRDTLENQTNFEASDYDDKHWQPVNLPHNAYPEQYVCNDMWQGTCWYRKTFDIKTRDENKVFLLEFEGAMGKSDYWINGHHVKTHQGGYLPVVFDITKYIQRGENQLAVKLDNRDNPLTGPKPLKKLDFCFYAGLYRNVNLLVKDKVHITHEAIANQEAGGGIFITTPEVSEEQSVIEIKTQLANTRPQPVNIQLRHIILFKGDTVQVLNQKLDSLNAGKTIQVVNQGIIEGGQLWSPTQPNLYHLKTQLICDNSIVEVQNTRFGLREFKFINKQLYINGKPSFLRGTNRHQEYPYVGYALSDNAQYRDAKKIKEAGFDYVRLSHYPHSPAFMDACDELGLVVLNAILGWQYYLDDDRFRDYCYNSASQLVKRDRNHPSVLAWEVSLNETKMPLFFMEELHRIVHAEHPGEHVYTAGWQPEVYDIFVQARQHRILHPIEYPNKPLMVSEYGDWEYYSRNAGLNQHNLPNDLRVEKSSRQLRKYGEKRMLQQGYNIQEAHNDNLQTTAFSDGYWVMYDYNSGCHNMHCCSGLMDINRIPKLASYFFESQRSIAEDTVLKIASYWTEQSSEYIKVYSNCDEVELLVNGNSLGKQLPDSDMISSNIIHPPFTFNVDTFKAGQLKARGYINNAVIKEHLVHTPLEPVALKLWLDESERPPEAGVNDILFLYIAAIDTNATINPFFNEEILVDLKGDARIMNTGSIVAEAGIATVVLQIGSNKSKILLEAKSKKLSGIKEFTPR